MVQTTKIEKKYKDKKTGEYKTITIQHAKVKDRLHEFWSTNANGKIDTSFQIVDGQTIFTAFIKKDCSVVGGEAKGHASSKTDNEKDFEKLETIAVGRALALLGFAASGEVASSEEMEEFNKFKIEKKEAKVNKAIKDMQKAKTLDELKKVFKTCGVMADPDVIAEKDRLKANLE